MRVLGYCFVFSALLLQFACPHKPIDPGTLDDDSAQLFSLPAPPTDGQITFRPSAFVTKGSFEPVADLSLNYNDQDITYDYVGSQIQYVRTRRSTGEFTYQPKWVISGSRSADDVTNRKNTLIVSILPAFDNVTSIPTYLTTLECSDAENIQNPLFCQNIMSAGSTAIFRTNNSAEFNSYESSLYAGCSATTTTGKYCFKSLSGVDLVAPYDLGAYNPGATIKLDDDIAAPANPYKEFWYTDDNLEKADGDTLSGKKYSVVIEFLDANSNLFTTKFPYAGDLDNLGNNTPAHLAIANFPDPKANVSSFTPDTPAGAQHDLEYIRTDDTATDIDAGAGVVERYFKNCTGLQDGANAEANGAYETKNPDSWGTVISCDKVIEATMATITETTFASHGVSHVVDDDIIHKMQLAGREFRAEGTDVDPRFEMLIRRIRFDVQRGYDRFID